MNRIVLPILALSLVACLPPAKETPEDTLVTSSTEPMDSEPPALEILSPKPGALVVVPGVEFIGVTEPGATLIGPGDVEQVVEDGNWRMPVTLIEGDNLLVFRARDAAGNENSTTVVVRYLPPLECSWENDFSADPDTCSYWGYIRSVNFGTGVLNFDLVSFERFGPAEWQFKIVNESEAIRNLTMAPDVEVWACPSEDDATYTWCATPDEFVQVNRENLNDWIGKDYKFWGLRLEDEVVVRIDQWWWP